MKTRLILIRHGRTRAADLGIHLGQYDGEVGRLSAEGNGQALLLAERLKDWEIDFLYCSDLTRCLETARYIAKECSLSIKTEPRLRETCIGKAGGLTCSEVQSLYPEEYANWMESPFDCRTMGGEHVDEMELRACTAFEELAFTHERQRICIVTHGGPIKAWLAKTMGTTFQQMCDHLVLDHTSITVLEYNGTQWTIERMNDRTHLYLGTMS